MSIKQFQEENRFLSSMYPIEEGIETADGFVAPTVEHVYQAYKFIDPDLQQKILNSKDGYHAKSLANQFEKKGFAKRSDWGYARVDIMRSLVFQKFTRSEAMKQSLLDTGDQLLEEGNTWRDTFWGIYPPGSGEGLNWLGRILMETREQLKEEAIAIHGSSQGA